MKKINRNILLAVLIVIGLLIVIPVALIYIKVHFFEGTDAINEKDTKVGEETLLRSNTHISANSQKSINCLADADCLETALLSCRKAEYDRFTGILNTHNKVAILDVGNESNCLIRTWQEDENGNVINYDKKCYIPKGYKFVGSDTGIILIPDRACDWFEKEKSAEIEFIDELVLTSDKKEITVAFSLVSKEGAGLLKDTHYLARSGELTIEIRNAEFEDLDVANIARDIKVAEMLEDKRPELDTGPLTKLPERQIKSEGDLIYEETRNIDKNEFTYYLVTSTDEETKVRGYTFNIPFSKLKSSSSNIGVVRLRFKSPSGKIIKREAVTERLPVLDK